MHREKEEYIVETIIGLLEFVAILISFSYSLIDVIRNFNSENVPLLNYSFETFCKQGFIYIIPCLAESVKFCIIKRKVYAFKFYKITRYNWYIVLFNVAYIVTYMIWSYCNYNWFLALLTLLAMSIYPMHSIMNSIFYMRQWKEFNKRFNE